MFRAIQASELYSELSGLAPSDEMQRLFSFAVDPSGGFDNNLQGKWFAYDDAAKMTYTVAAYGPFQSAEEAAAYMIS